MRTKDMTPLSTRSKTNPPPQAPLLTMPGLTDVRTARTPAFQGCFQRPPPSIHRRPRRGNEVFQVKGHNKRNKPRSKQGQQTQTRRVQQGTKGHTVAQKGLHPGAKGVTWGDHTWRYPWLATRGDCYNGGPEGPVGRSTRQSAEQAQTAQPAF